MLRYDLSWQRIDIKAPIPENLNAVMALDDVAARQGGEVTDHRRLRVALNSIEVSLDSHALAAA